MELLKEKAMQYQDGLYTSQEFIGHVVHLLGEHWHSIPDTECNDEFANQLAALFTK